MKLLLDTHVLLWWLVGDARLPQRARGAIIDSANTVAVSVASIWEVAIKASIGRLEMEGSLPEAVAAEGFDILPITAEHAWAQAALPLHHRDPFDRLLVAQARAEGLTLVTIDAGFAPYEVRLLKVT